MNSKRGAAWPRGWRGLACLVLCGVLLAVPGLALASPGCQAVNGQSGTLGAYEAVVLLPNSNPVNQGDQVAFTASGQAQYVGSFIHLIVNGGTTSGAEGGSGASADGIANLQSSAVTYSVSCVSTPPIVFGVSPSSATPGQTVTIFGSGFFGTSAVTFGSATATSFTVNDGGSITATVPNFTGTVAVNVTTDGGTASGGSFTFAAPPTVSAVSSTVAFDSSNNAIPLSISGAATSVAIADAPSHGTASASGTSITYSPNANYVGSDSFTYTASNAAGTSAPATVTITVSPPPVPTAAAASKTTAYNTPVSINLASAISGLDITGINVSSGPGHGTVSVSGETVTYTPSSTFYGGSDSFTYTATNPGGTSAPATVTVTVGAVAVPTVAPVSTTTPYSKAVSINLADTIRGVDITAVTVASPPAHGTVSVSGEMVTYTPSSAFDGGIDSFTYTASNPGGISSPATVTVTVRPLSAPSARAISVSTTAGTSVLIEATAGATGPEPPTSVSVASVPAHGSASASGKQITYVPAAGFVGSDSFSYRVANRLGSSAPATITVTVTSAGSLGAATGTKTVATTPGDTLTVNLSKIVPGTYVSSALTGLSPGNAGQAKLSQPATLIFTSDPSFRGLAQISAVLVAASGRQVTIDMLVLVSSHPDPSKNPEVLGLVNAQIEQAKRFAQSQLDNIDGRLESLHDGSGTALFSNTLAISLDGRALQAPQRGDPGNRSEVDRDENPFGAILRPGMGGADEGAFGAAQAGSSAAPAAKPSTTISGTPTRLGLWIAGVANFGSFQAYRQASGFDSDSIAVNIGMDQRINRHALLGFSLGFNHDNADIASNGARSIANGYSAALYGSYQPSAHTYVDMVLGGGGLSFDSRRHDADSGSRVTGRRNGSEWFGSLTSGYEYHNRGGLLLSPYLRLEQSLSELDGFSEQGAVTAALRYGSQTVRTSLAVLGVRARKQLSLDWGTLVPQARLEIGHDFQGTSETTLSYAFIPSAGSWNALTNPYGANGTSVQLGLGLDLQLPRALRLTMDYQYLTQPHAHDQMIRLGLNKQF